MLRQGEYLYTSKEMEQLQDGWTQYWIQDYYCTRWKWTHKYHRALSWKNYQKIQQLLMAGNEFTWLSTYYIYTTFPT